MKALVTGASGFLGSRVARRLVDEGYDVAVLIRATSSRERLAGVLVEEFVGALADTGIVADAVAGRELVVHCAALCADAGALDDFRESNAEGTRHLLEAARSSPSLRRLVHVSTTDVYGYPRHPGDESAPLRDVGLPYNETKVEAERAMWQGVAEGLPVTILRPATIYGPGAPAVVRSIVHALEAGSMVHIGDGRAPAGLIHVDDVVEAVVAAATSDRAVGRAYNLCHPEPVTWRQFTEAVADAVGARRPRASIPVPVALGIARAAERFAAVSGREPLLTRHATLLLGRSQAFDPSRAAAELGVRPRIGFASGIVDTFTGTAGESESAAPGRHLGDRSSLPPGPRLPTAVQSVLWMRRPLDFLSRCERRFGGPFTLRLSGWGTTVMVWEPAEVRELFRGEGEGLRTGEANALMRPLVGDTSIFVVDGDEHRRLRRSLGSGLRLEAFYDAAAFHAATRRALDRTPTDRRVSLQRLCGAITLQTIAATVLGLEPGPQLDRTQTLLGRALGPLGTVVASVQPLRAALDRLGPALRLPNFLEEIDDVILEQVRRRRASGGLGDHDLLSRLVDPAPDGGEPLSDSVVRDQVISLVVAGNETVATALAWALHWIHHDAGVLERLVGEIDHVDPGDAEALSACTYLDAVVNESLRLCPVVELMSRATTEGFEFRGHVLPPGTLLSACSYLSHRDPATFEEPARFRPDRFLDRTYSPYEFYPFGGGIRRCLGAAMAALEMKVVLVTMLQERRIEVVPTDVTARRRNVIIAPGGGVPAVLHRRTERPAGRQGSPARAPEDENATS